jgi:tartrate dehydratase alpha subunit/fumarate hydratase class I-like protein
MLRVSHQQQVASILLDPEASDNDKYVALQFLRNSEIAAKGVLPTCQDTGTAIIMGKKGQRVWTGGGDEAALAQGVYNTYTEDNLRYSQNARWICIKRSTPAPTCRRRSISTASTATNINSCAWRKAAVPPTKPISIRKPKR